MRRLAPAFCLAVLVCACAGPPKRAPVVSLPVRYEGPSGVTQLTPAELDRWWLLFNDPSLLRSRMKLFAPAPDARTATAPSSRPAPRAAVWWRRPSPPETFKATPLTATRTTSGRRRIRCSLWAERPTPRRLTSTYRGNSISSAVWRRSGGRPTPILQPPGSTSKAHARAWRPALPTACSSPEASPSS